MLDTEKTALVVIDVQTKLSQLMPEKDQLLRRVVQIIEGARVLKLPIVWTEQYPEGMGPTVSQVAEHLAGLRPFSKKAFSCCGDELIRRHIHALGRKQFLLAGIESHVCVYQTALDLLEMGYEVEVVADAVASRAPDNLRIGLERVRRAGAAITSVETALFELLRVAEGPRFKEILKIVK